MTKPSMIQAVPRPRGTLSEEVLWHLSSAKAAVEKAERNYRCAVVGALAEGSFAEVSKATGLSTNTLQRWKREVGTSSGDVNAGGQRQTATSANPRAATRPPSTPRRKDDLK